MLDQPATGEPVHKPYACPACGASDWRADYYQAVHQGCDLAVDENGNLYASDYHGDEESYDDGSTTDEAFACGACGYRIEGPAQGDFCVLGHDGFTVTIKAEEADPNDVCPECGGGENNIQGCPACCRDCGRPCDTEKDGQGFHQEQTEPDPDEDEDRGLACDDVSPATPGELEDERG